MTQIAVVGSDEFTLGFRLVGVRRIFPASTPTELQQAVQAAREDEETSILVMQTSDLEQLDPRLRRDLAASVRPTMVAVGIEEDNTLRDKIKQAIGVDLW